MCRDAMLEYGLAVINPVRTIDLKWIGLGHHAGNNRWVLPFETLSRYCYCIFMMVWPRNIEILMIFRPLWNCTRIKSNFHLEWFQSELPWRYRRSSRWDVYFEPLFWRKVAVFMTSDPLVSNYETRHELRPISSAAPFEVGCLFIDLTS